MTVINEMELEKYGTKKPKKNFNKVHNDNDNGRYILVSKDHQVHEENCVSEEIFQATIQGEQKVSPFLMIFE